MPIASFLHFFSPQNSLAFPSFRKFVPPKKRPCSLPFSTPASGFHCFVSNRSEGKGKSSRKLEFDLSGYPAMDSQSISFLMLSGKSSAEMEFTKSLKAINTLKLPDNCEMLILLHREIEKNRQRAFSDGFVHEFSTNGNFWQVPHLVFSTNGNFWQVPHLVSSVAFDSRRGFSVSTSNFCELPIDNVCVADAQLKGRGRSKNEWESPRGCLMFSFTIQMEDGRAVPLLQYVVSLAMTEAIKGLCDSNGLPHVNIKIKWPNDLFINGVKVGGILCTSTYKLKKFNVSADVGLNVDNKKPTTCLNAVLRELSSVAYQFRREDILAAFFNKFEALFNLFINEGFQTLEELYYKTWLHSDQRVIVQENNEGQMVESVVTIQGLTSSGYLLAVGDDGQMCELHPDGNSFDFFKGLVRRKMD